MSKKQESRNKKIVDLEEVQLEKSIAGLDFPSLELSYDESRRIVEIQIERIDAADAKASVLVGFSGIILTALFSGLSSFLSLKPDFLNIIVLGFASLSIVISAGAGLYSYRLNPDFYMSPFPSILRDRYIYWKPHNFKYLFLNQLADLTELNHELLSKKLRWISVCLSFMLIGIILTLISAILVFVL